MDPRPGVRGLMRVGLGLGVSPEHPQECLPLAVEGPCATLETP